MNAHRGQPPRPPVTRRLLLALEVRNRNCGTKSAKLTANSNLGLCDACSAQIFYGYTTISNILVVVASKRLRQDEVVHISLHFVCVLVMTERRLQRRATSSRYRRTSESMGFHHPARLQRSTEASPLLPADDIAVTVSRRLSGGTGSMTKSHFAMPMVYLMPN
jgi:hypothetical protein